MRSPTVRRRAPVTGRRIELRLRARPGIALILVGLLLVTFVGVAAVALDFGGMYLYRTQLHTASDAAALAGAERLMRNDAAGAQDTAIAYGISHPVEKSMATMTPGDVIPGEWNPVSQTFTPAPGANWFAPDVNAVQATAHHQAAFTFGRLFGYSTRGRSATSIASVGSVGSTYCVRPFAIPYERMLQVLHPVNTPPVTYNLTPADITALRNATMANQILLKVGDATLSPVPGAFYAIREPPVLYANGTAGNPWSGASNYRDAITAPCSGLPQNIGPGDWLVAEQGNMQGPTRDGVASQCQVAGNLQSFTCPTPVPIKIVLWDISDKTVASPNAFRVKYVGAFFMTGFVKGTGSEADGVTGYFHSLASPGTFNPVPGPLDMIALVR